MSAATNLWPDGDNKELIIAIANYLQDLLNANESKLDEVSTDSLQIATESLQTIISPDDDQLPKSSFSLTKLYQTYKSQTSSSSTTDNEQKTQSLPADIEKRRQKFLEFIKVLKKHDFFKGCTEGSSDYLKRMEKARTQYNTRFKDMSIDSIEWLKESETGPTPMDTDNDTNKPVTEDDKKEAERLKGEGNQLLGQKKYNQAVDKYTQAINKNPQNAVYYSNRAAAHTYLKNYKQAVSDSRQASTIDPNYVKAYVREGLAEYEMANYQEALEAYQKALNLTKSTDKAWENYMEKVELCRMKLEEVNNGGASSGGSGGGGAAANNPFAGLGAMGGGGGPDLSSLLSGLGGGGGGGLDFNKLMQNPQLQQMAQQMMQDPNAMANMAKMMGQMGGGGGMPGGDTGGGGGNDDGAMISDLLGDPEKATEVFKKAMEDPEVKQLLQQDPSIEPLINRIKGGDYAAFMELGQKPQAMAKVKRMIKKYYEK